MGFVPRALTESRFWVAAVGRGPPVGGNLQPVSMTDSSTFGSIGRGGVFCFVVSTVLFVDADHDIHHDTGSLYIL